MFSEELSRENQATWSDQEKLDNLKRLYEHAETKNLPKNFRLEFLHEILTVGAKIGVFDEKFFRTFMSYIKKDNTIFANYEKPGRINPRTKTKTNWNQYISSVRTNDTKDVESGSRS